MEKIERYIDSIAKFYEGKKSRKKFAAFIFNEAINALECQGIVFEEFFHDFGYVFLELSQSDVLYFCGETVYYNNISRNYYMDRIAKLLRLEKKDCVRNNDYCANLMFNEIVCLTIENRMLPFHLVTDDDNIIHIEFSKLMCQKYEQLKSEPRPDHEGKAFETPNGNTATTDSDQQPKQEQQQDLPEINVMSSVLLLWYLHEHQGKYVGLKGGSINMSAVSTMEQIQKFKNDFGFKSGSDSTFNSKLSLFNTMNKDSSDRYKRFALPIEPYIKKFPKAYEEYKKHLAQPTNERPPRKPK